MQHARSTFGRWGPRDVIAISIAYNNPVVYNDPDDKCPSCIIGGITGFAVDAVVQVTSSMAKSAMNGEKITFNTVMRDYSGFQGGAAFGAGFLTQGLSAVEQGTAATVKIAVANVSISVVNQTNKDGAVDPVTTALDALPLPDVKVGNVVNTKNAEKAIAQAENSISKSTSAIRVRKVAQRNDAKMQLQTQQQGNAGAKSTATGLRDGAVKEVANTTKALVGNSAAPTNTPSPSKPLMPTFNIPTNDNTRVVNKFQFGSKRIA